MSWSDKLGNTRNQLRSLNKCIPDTAQAFGALGKSVKEGGTLDFKTKEYIALGIAVATKCEACITIHIETLIRCGATRDEVEKALSGSVISCAVLTGTFAGAEEIEWDFTEESED